MRRNQSRPDRPGRVRIVAGSLRGRLIPVPDAPGLRPTPDRMRETLFNWLTPVIEGARCLDLFAGSGALGFEAASRGASEVIMVERDRGIADHLAATARTLGVGAVSVIATEAMDFLDREAKPFDIIFLDPPFGQGMVAPAIARIAARNLVQPGGHLYLEAETALQEPALPTGWEVLRRQRAGLATGRLICSAGGEESRLWEEEVRDVRPLAQPGTPADIHLPAPDPDGSATESPGIQGIGASPFPPERQDWPMLAHGVAPDLDGRTLQRLRQGRLPIEAQLDLHGHTRDNAHRALVAFLTAAHAEGKRCVLVITGKGRPGPDAENGILRVEIPRWLNGVTLRPLMLAFCYARPQDGGEGALYILLRRRR